MLLAVAEIIAEPPPSFNDLLLGGIACISATSGLAALYLGLAREQMGIVAPVAGVVAAILPILVAFFTEGLPTNSQLIGFGLVQLAVWLLSGTGDSMTFTRRDLRLPMFAGMGFALF